MYHTIIAKEAGTARALSLSDVSANSPAPRRQKHPHDESERKPVVNGLIVEIGLMNGLIVEIGLMNGLMVEIGLISGLIDEIGLMNGLTMLLVSGVPIERGVPIESGLVKLRLPAITAPPS